MGTVASNVWMVTYDLIVSFYRDIRRRVFIRSEARNTGMEYLILVGSYNDSIYTVSFDPSKAPDEALSLVSSVTVGHHPSWITRRVHDPTVIYTGLEQADGQLLALVYALQPGKGILIADHPSGGSDPCSILETETNLFVANYSSGTIGIFERFGLGTYGFRESQPPLKLSGSGPCSERQGSSHPHQVYLAKQGTSSALGRRSQILVPDLGADKIWRVTRDPDGKWTVQDEIIFDKHPGGGPRHVVVYDSKLYTLLELTNKITVHDLRISESQPPLVAEASLPMPENISILTMLAAEILCPEPNFQYPTPYLYVSNRNDPRPHGDLISIFAMHKDGQDYLEHVNDIPTGLAHVRGFIFFGPNDRYIVTGGANGGGTKVFERIDEGRDMREVAHLPASNGGAGLAPTAFHCLRPYTV